MLEASVAAQSRVRRVRERVSVRRTRHALGIFGVGLLFSRKSVLSRHAQRNTSAKAGQNLGAEVTGRERFLCDG
jgi:hypothetical protein